MENKNFVHAFYVDTEGGSLYKLMVSMGIDLSKIEHVLVENAEDSIITCLNILKTIKEFQEIIQMLDLLLSLIRLELLELSNYLPML